MWCLNGLNGYFCGSLWFVCCVQGIIWTTFLLILHSMMLLCISHSPITLVYINIYIWVCKSKSCLTFYTKLQKLEKNEFVMRNYWSDWHKYDSNYTWWHGNMQMPPALLALCVGNPLIADGCTSLRASKVELCYCLCCQLNQLFNKQLGGQWFAMMLLALHYNSITLEWCPLWAERWFAGLCGLWGFIW